MENMVLRRLSNRSRISLKDLICVSLVALVLLNYKIKKEKVDLTL